MSNLGTHWKTTKNHKGSSGKHWKLSDETRNRMSKAKKGREVSDETRLKLSIINKGKRRGEISKETREKLSLALKNYFANGGIPSMGRLGMKASPETIIKLRDSHRGKPVPIRQGAGCHFWKGGITPINEKIRASLDYGNWRQSIFERDSFACILCGNNKSGNLRAHHIRNFNNYPELRFDLNNGITLCEECHKSFHKEYGRINNTKEQLEEFLADEILESINGGLT